MGLAALIAWLLTASIGGYMLRTWVARGGLRHQRATGVGVPPGVVFGHGGAALTGLTVWISYVSSGWHPLAWVGVALAGSAICLGICTVTLWTPYPVLPELGAGGHGEPDLRAAGAAGAAAGFQERPTAAAGPHDAFTVTDEMIASLLTEPSPAPRRSRRHLLPLSPLTHGLGAVATFLLTVTAALLPVR